jgi:predicted 3-demethylubiquinone-9 3-methyltransferase (glyoxalase superfamily)
MARAVSTFLMFEGVAEEAMNFYVSLFSDAEVIRIERYGAGERGRENSVKKADFRLGKQNFTCSDSAVQHAFSFTPSMSIFVDCENEAELDTLYQHLSTDGEVLMPLGKYWFSTKFGWVNDHFGVSWQLNLDQ